MKELLLRSMFDPGDRCLFVRYMDNSVYLQVRHLGLMKDVCISQADARKLVEMLVKHTHPGQTIEPSKPAKTPQLILAWQHPENGRRFSYVSNEAAATDGAVNLKSGLLDFPIWLAQITKQYVQPNPTYEWKDI